MANNGTTKNSETYKDSIQGRESGIQFFFKTIKQKGSKLLLDKSYLLIQNSFGTLIKLFQGNIALGGSGDVNINAGHNIHMSSQNIQITSNGKFGLYNKKGKIDINGKCSDEDSAKIKQYTDLLNQIDEAAHKAFESATAEKVVCTNCAQKHLADDKSDNWTIILDAIRKATENLPYFKGPFAVLRWLITKVYVPLLASISNLSLSNGKGCGPGCEQGLKDGMANKIKASEDAVKAEMEKLSEIMNKLTVDLSPNSTGAETFEYGKMIIVGDPAHSSRKSPYKTQGYNSLPMNLRVADNLRNKLRVTTEGNCKKIAYLPPQQSPYGNLGITVANNFKLTAGVNGIDLLSTGEIALKGGSVHINGSEGEVSLTSNNLTTIGGGNVLIAADNKSGDTGVCIDSKHTYVRGAFNVNGDTAMLGGLTVDGALSVNYINCPSMAAPSTMNGAADFVTHHANWLGTSLALNAANFVKKKIEYTLQPSLLMTPVGITDVFMEAYNLIIQSTTLEVIPTGIFKGVAITAGFGGGAGVCFGLVWNFKHNHTVAPGDHTHETSVPNGGYWRKASGAGQARVAGNPAPTPAPVNGSYPRPGPRSMGGGCGGGGLYSKVRNLKYNINSDDAFNGGNYVTTTVVRNADGSINPTPDLTYRYVKDYGNNTKIDSTTGTVSYPLTGINC